MQLIYRLSLATYRAAIFLASPFVSKARKWRAGRKGLLPAIEKTIPKGTPIIWFHAASLGEFEQGRPVIEAWKSQHPGYKILLTFFSPSGYEIRKDYAHADWVFYLPPDSPANARRFVQAVEPRAAVFIKYEFWLFYLRELQQAGIPAYSVSAIFRKGQLFFRPWGKAYRKILYLFAHIFVQDTASAQLLRQYGIKHVSISGDTRYDRVAAIAQKTGTLDKLEAFTAQGGPVLVAGSTWPDDEQALRPFLQAHAQALKIVIAPHEVHETNILRLQKLFGFLPLVRYSEATQDKLKQARLLLVDNIGLLSSIYGYATLAYVGGAFRTGLHNVLEPATFGIPVVFGPAYSKFREATQLIEAGGGFPAQKPEAVQQILRSLLQNTEKCKQAGQASRQLIRNNQGATEHIIEKLQAGVSPV